MPDERRVSDPVTQEEWIVPSWSGEHDTLERAAAHRDGRLRRIRFSTDYTAELPLWETGLLDDDETGLSADLLRELKAWVARWESAFDPFSGWRDPALREPRIREGHALADRVERELWTTAEIIRTHDWV